MRQINKIIIHHSDTYDNRALNWQDIRKYHCSYRIDNKIVSRDEFINRLKTMDGQKFEKPFMDIGYHYGIELINLNYEILVGRPLNHEGAHTQGQNKDSIGICFVGNWNNNFVPEIMIITAVFRLIVPLCLIFNLTERNIFGHSNFNHTDCPGKLFDLRYLQEMVNRGLKSHSR